MSLTEQITRRVAEAGGRIRVKSALNPVLWLCGIIVVPTLVVAASVGNNAPWWLVSLLAFAIVVTMALAVFCVVYLTLFDRDKLQSEEYQLKKLSLEYIQEKDRLSRDEHSLIEQMPNPEGGPLVRRNGERR